MSMPRDTLITLVQECGDFTDSPRWGRTLILQALAGAHWREWRGLLAVNRMLRVAERTVTTDANGRFAKADLNSGSGNATETAHQRAYDAK